MVNFLFNSISYYQFKSKGKTVICDNSYYVKLLVNVLDVMLVLLESQNIPHYNNIKEYLGVVFIIAYLMTFAYDWQGYTIQFSISSTGFIKFTKDNTLAVPFNAHIVSPSPVYVQMPVMSHH